MKPKNIIIILVSVMVIVSISLTLISNKKKINAANQMTDRSAIRVSVSTFKAATGAMATQTSLPARLNPGEDATVSVQTAGIISYLTIDEGSRVAQGQVVGAVDTKVAQLNLKAVLQTKDKLEDDYERAKELYEGKAASEVNLIAAKYNYDNTTVQAEQIKQQIDNANIVAPISGIVTSCNLRAGEYANPGAAIASLVGIDKLKATVFVDETEVYKLRTGELVEIVVPVFPGKKFKGIISYISPNGDENHNYQVDATVNNNTGELKAGTNVLVNFELNQKPNAIMIPKIALVADRKEPYVFVISNDIARGRKVVTGLSQGEYIEIVDGLSSGEEVVLTGQINLADGSKITRIN